MSTRAAVGVTIAMGLAASACSRDRPASEPRAQEPTATVATVPEAPPSPAEEEAEDVATAPVEGESQSASESIAQSRCQREIRCNNVGSGRTYSSLDDCLARVRSDWSEDLNARECPGGINRAELDECLTEVQNEDCGNPLDTLGRIASCTTGQICETTSG